MNTPPTARFELLQPGAGLTELASLWRELESRADASFFQSWGWMGPWLEMALRHAPVYLYRLDAGTRPVALGLLTPFSYRRGGVFRTRALALNELRLPGLDMCIEFNDLLCERGSEEAAWRELLPALQRADIRWSELRLSAIPEATLTRLAGIGSAVYLEPDEIRAPWASDIAGCDTLDKVLARLSRNRRWQVRRSIKHYEETLGPIRATIATTADAALRDFEDMGVLHTARWERAGLKGSFGNPQWVAFQRRVITGSFDAGQIQLVRVEAGDTLLGVVYSFLWRGRVYMLQTGFIEPRDNVERPGYISHCLAMSLNGALGMQVYDFMCGDAEYKQSLAQAGPALHWVRVRRRTWGNRAEDLILRMYRESKERLLRHRRRTDQNAAQT